MVLPTWGVGNPGEGDISGGGLDAFLIELAADKRVIGSANPPNLLSVHEYAQTSTLAEQPYRIGRVSWMLDRALDKLKLPIDPRRVAITEYGRDVGGDPLKDGGMRFFGGDEQKFYDFLTPGALLYLQLGFLGAALYCQGSTWPSFDWQHATRLIELMTQWNQEHPIMTAPPIIPAPCDERVDEDVTITGFPPGIVYRYVRAFPDATSEDLGKLKVGDLVGACLHNLTVSGWCYVRRGSDGVKGWVWWTGVESKPSWVDPAPVDTPLVNLDMSYVGQVSPTANHFNNDCGCACALMAIIWRYQSVRLLVPTYTVNELAAKTTLPLHDNGLTTSQLVTLLEGYGVWAQVGKAIDASAIRRNLDIGMPVICLLNYGDFNPNNTFKGGHFAIAKGYGANGVYFDDPYAGGANFYVTDTALNKALSDAGAFSSTPNQGVTFVV